MPAVKSLLLSPDALERFLWSDALKRFRAGALVRFSVLGSFRPWHAWLRPPVPFWAPVSSLGREGWQAEVDASC
eukprot:6178283-Pleurochrysis_carterae.AAC.1